MSFADDMRRFTEKTITAGDKITRTATLDLFGGVIRATPVDTGRARGAWTTSVGAPADSPDRSDKVAVGQNGGAAMAEVYEKTPAGAGQVTFLANNMPYIHDLELGGYSGPTEKVTDGGFSRQAPAGMVRINMDRVQPMVDAAIRKNRV
ncbi:hypothetical protein [Stutzerimonas stutzeri]|uniref:HK97 gp10 family phage protein n=1 Tax=Stutzerimonas stutzeri KOS6 TaxID=1218352 RepID=A0A061JLS4_STUST|nr:hypothetical protein [Stutzerimonas stutzeri]EWC39548.1 hypothetical protein B597_019350 [Stutzerimonas stutzeri KOS6]